MGGRKAQRATVRQPSSAVRAKRNKTGAQQAAAALSPATLAVIASFCEPTLLMALVSKQFLEVAEEIGEVQTKSADIEGRLALLEWAQYNGLPRRMKLRVAANGGHLQLRKMSPFSDWEASIVGKGAAEGGHLNVLDWIGRRGWDRVCEAAAGKCQWHVVQWALGNGLKPDSSVVVAAAQAGETSLMARALSVHTYWQRMDEAYAASVSRGDLSTFRVLARHDTHINIAVLMRAPLAFIQSAATILTRKRGFHMSTSVDGFVERAIAAGRLDALQWALDHADIIPPKPAYVAWDFCPAAENGHINILQWAKDTHRRAPSTMQKWALAAATGGQVGVISWVASQPHTTLEWNAVAKAAWVAADPEIVKLAQSRGADISTFSLYDVGSEDWITFDGHSRLDKILNLELLQLAKANMIDIPDFVSFKAAQQGRVDVLRWLHDSGSMSIADDIFETAAKAGHVDVVAWGLESGYGVRSGVLEAAAAEGHFHILKWAHAAGVPFTEWVLRDAIYCGKLNIIKWLCKHKCPGWDSNLPAMANIYTRQIVKRWLVLNNTRARRTGRGARK